MFSILLSLVLMLSVVQPTVVMASLQNMDTLSDLSPISISGQVTFRYRPLISSVELPERLWQDFPISISYTLRVPLAEDGYRVITGETEVFTNSNGEFSYVLNYDYPVLSGSAIITVTAADHASFVAEFSK